MIVYDFAIACRCLFFFLRKENCTPECLWAERKDFIFLTVQVTSPENLKVDLKEQSLDFYCTKGDKAYSCHLDFPEPINVEVSRALQLCIRVWPSPPKVDLQRLSVPHSLLLCVDV